MQQVGFRFYLCWYLSIFRKSLERIQVSLKSDSNNRYFTLRLIYIFNDISLSPSLNEKCFRKSCTENKNTHFIFNNFFFSRKWCRLRDNAKKILNSLAGRRWQYDACPLHCWIPKATNTLSEYVIFIAFPLQQRLHESSSTLRYAYIACLVIHT